MQKLVKLSTLVVAMGLAAAAQADVSVPTFKGGFDVSLEGNYLKATAGGQTYIPNNFVDVVGDKVILNWGKLDQPYKLGFGGTVGYKIPNSSNDITLSYSQIKSNKTSDVVAFGPEDIEDIEIGTILDLDIMGLQGTEKASAEFKAQTADLMLGQYIKFGDSMTVRLSGGLGYAKLDNTQFNSVDFHADEATVYLAGFIPVEDYENIDGFVSLTRNSTFKGLGPKFGLDFDYHVANGFNVVGGMSAGLLIGKIDSNATLHDTVTATDVEEDIREIDTFNLVSTKKDQRKVVPTFEAKLGLGYTYAVNDSYNMSIEGGYQVKHFADAIGHIDFEGGTEYSSLSFDGPYLKLKLAAC